MNKLLALAYIASVGVAIVIAGQYITNRVSDYQDVQDESPIARILFGPRN